MAIIIRTTEIFDVWLAALADKRARAIITTRLIRLEAGLFGDVKPVGEGISELRIDHGPGYRLYFARHGNSVVVLLIGGDKGSQKQDIARAKALWAQRKE